MKVAVVYYSMSGNTKYVADKIAENLEGKAQVDKVEILPVKAFPDSGFKKFLWGGKSALMGEKPELMPYEFDASLYDKIIIGTPVWASSCTPPMRTFLETHGDEIKEKDLGIYVCYSGGGAEKAIKKIKKYIGIEKAVTIELIDPKDKPNKDNEQKISGFCKKLQ